MNIEASLDIATLALEFINHTHRNVFLTGGAGTGKTTFLKFLKRHTHKKMVIAAPTGVAAINAGGITIHSLFSLPIHLNEETILSNLHMNNQTKSLLQELELLVIDEASMLRADILDVIDTLLREVRQQNLPMGGIQVVFIGDLFQLPPIVNKHDDARNKETYPSLYFTNAKVFNNLDLLILELTTVHRQSDPEFINLLNGVRKASLSLDQLNSLNKRYCSIWGTKDMILLTTHNRYAYELNNQKLTCLSGPIHTFEAEVTGEFPEDKAPLDPVLQLKLGCRIMIIKNDVSANRLYYNGKTGIITAISDQVIDIKFDNNVIIKLEKEIWSNIGYSASGEYNPLKEVVLGTFRQFPVKLAWAITIHKSQGLTFENAIIDVAEAFAPGQVYVALSRVKSMDGIFLTSKIPMSAIVAPALKNNISQSPQYINQLALTLKESKRIYMGDFVRKSFEWQHLNSVLLQSSSTNPVLLKLREASGKLGKHALAFVSEIGEYLSLHNDPDWLALAVRFGKAENYFSQEIANALIGPTKDFIRKHKSDFMFRGEVNIIKGYLQLFQTKLQAIIFAKQVAKNFADGIMYLPQDTVASIQESTIKEINNLPSTYESSKSTVESQTLELFLAGKSIPEIAILRSFGIPAIESHLASYLPSGKVLLTDIISKEVLDQILPRIKEMKSPTISQIRPFAEGKLTMGQLYALTIYLKDQPS